MNNRLSNLWMALRKDKNLILLCIAMAFIAWQSIRKNIGFEVSVSNIVVDVDVPPGWAVWEKSVHRVNVLFRGSREDIRYLNNEQLRVRIPVPDPERGRELNIRLTEKMLRNPTTAKVVRFSPPEVVIKLDQESERLLPVKATLNGSLPAGLEIEKIACTPASVRITGAREVIDAMESIHTEPIDLRDRQASFKESVPVALLEAGRMRVDPEWVSVELTLEARSSTRIFEQVPIRVLSASGEHRMIAVQPQSITLTVRGQQQRMEQLRSADIFAYVSCAELSESTGYDLPVVVDLPSGLQLVKTEPAVVHVDIGTMN